LLDQCYQNGSKVLLLGYLGNGWRFLPLHLASLDPHVRRRVLNTTHLQKTPAKLAEQLGVRWVPSAGLDEALLACLNAAGTEDSEVTDSD
jgi:hypothetical protein